jgi:hypothetical protein
MDHRANGQRVLTAVTVSCFIEFELGSRGLAIYFICNLDFCCRVSFKMKVVPYIKFKQNNMFVTND